MKSKEKLNNILKFSGPKPAYLTYTEVNSHVWRGPVNIGFTGPGRALDAPGLGIAETLIYILSYFLEF
jgi:hypothetical protein